MDQVTLKNFRCFREKQTVRLAPLTLLVGENSTGKTSFMAMIRALWDVAYQQSIPDFKEEPYDLGSFDEITHHRGGRSGQADIFEAGFELTRGDKETRADRLGTYRFEVIFGRNGTVPTPVSIRIASEDTWIEEYLKRGQLGQFRFGTSKGAWQLQEGADRRPLLDTDLYLMRPLSSSFFTLSHAWRTGKDRENKPELTILQGSKNPTDEEWEMLQQFTEISEMRGILPYSDQRPYASAPVRSKPLRTYDPWHSTRDSEGDYVPTYLANLYSQDEAKWNALRHALEKFGKDAGLFDEISVRQLGKNKNGPFQIQIRKFGDRTKGPQRNLIDVGYGVSQVLPVMTELLRSDAPAMFLLQQPEVHLHPSAQAALGSLFCQVAPRRRLIVETHSDHLLDRVRMDVRDGTTSLRPEDVSILFFERRDLDVRIHSLRLDREGNVLDAPPSYRQFFMEETRRSLRL